MPREISYSSLPEHMREGARLYIEDGIEPGSFLTAVLSNDLKGAYSRADEINSMRMRDWASWLLNVCPMAAQGNLDRVDAWIESGGLNGRGE